MATSTLAHGGTSVPIGVGTWAWGNQFLWGYDPAQDAQLGPPEKVKPKSASTKWTFVEHADRSSRRSHLRLHRQSTDTLTALIEQENA